LTLSSFGSFLPAQSEGIFFYNSATGEAAIGGIVGGEFITRVSYPPGAFGAGWSHLAEIPLTQGELFFYNSTAKSAATGRLTGKGFATSKVYEANSFGLWTHLTGVLEEEFGSILFYNADTGAGAVGFDPTVKDYPAGSFSKSWSHIVSGRRSNRILFYDSTNGSGALDFDPSTQIFPPGSFSTGWTHLAIAPLDSGEDAILFYNDVTRAGAIGTLQGTGFQTEVSYDPGAFGKWTHIVGYTNGFLFLNSDTGEGVVTALDENRHLLNVKFYPAGSFATGWTHLVTASLDTMEGFCWPMSARPGEEIEFRTSTEAASYTVTYVRLRNSDPNDITAADIENSRELFEEAVVGPIEQQGNVQNTDHTPAEGCDDWATSFVLTIPEDWPSGLYAAKCVDLAGSTTYIQFVVNPPLESQAKIAVIVNVTTWNAYNSWGGYSRYSVAGPGAWEFSYLRPNSYILNPHRHDPGYHYNSKHQARGEQWVLNWLEDEGYDYDAYTDLDLHDGIAGLSDYRAIVLSTHPEYFSVPMMIALRTYVDGGGHLLYLGANGLYDAVDVSDDLTRITVYGTYGQGRTHLFRNPPVSLPESELLGIAFPWSPDGGDEGNRGSRVPYHVKAADHWLFDGTGLQDEEAFGELGWCTIEGSPTLEGGGASGWEVDFRDEHSPPSVELLALGENGAEMIYYDHPGGGFVFSVGSMSFCGSLVVDERVQQIVRNALDRAIEVQGEKVFRRGDADGSGGLEITDAIFVLGFLFNGGKEPKCFDSADADDSGILDITDPIRILGYLFLGGEAPPAPGAGACGVDQTPDQLGQCGSQCQ